MIRLLRDEIFIPIGPVSPLAQGDTVTLMQADAARVRVINNTYSADLGERTAGFLAEQGMNVVEQGISTGEANQTVLVMYAPKLYALRYLIETFGVRESNQVVIKPDPTETVDIEILIGEDWVSRLPTGYYSYPAHGATQQLLAWQLRHRRLLGFSSKTILRCVLMKFISIYSMEALKIRPYRRALL